MRIQATYWSTPTFFWATMQPRKRFKVLQAVKTNEATRNGQPRPIELLPVDQIVRAISKTTEGPASQTHSRTGPQQLSSLRVDQIKSPTATSGISGDSAASPPSRSSWTITAAIATTGTETNG